MTNDHASQRLEKDYLVVAEMWPELIDRTSSEFWLLVENEALNNVERLFDDVH